MFTYRQMRTRQYLTLYIIFINFWMSILICSSTKTLLCLLVIQRCPHHTILLILLSYNLLQFFDLFRHASCKVRQLLSTFVQIGKFRCFGLRQEVH